MQDQELESRRQPIVPLCGYRLATPATLLDPGRNGPVIPPGPSSSVERECKQPGLLPALHKT